MRIRLQIGTPLVQVRLLEPVERNTSMILASCPISNEHRGFVATEHQQNYWANEVNYLLLNKRGATLTDVGNFLKQNLEELPKHSLIGMTP